eukprot:CAMPEP_0182549966 /NCGR_PEP_ID=MMETSP1323-20130603/40930_1 /TAXON_ID=236787 /ORGANISM="Florenciella parvula, Strain RCC1693" /LENGTH=76 /DNA_ID=CAMNT_0024761463 /DNA_START=96 /DNA_END=326 /DNA_ORIENTATION=-
MTQLPETGRYPSSSLHFQSSLEYPVHSAGGSEGGTASPDCISDAPSFNSASALSSEMLLSTLPSSSLSAASSLTLL